MYVNILSTWNGYLCSEIVSYICAFKIKLMNWLIDWTCLLDTLSTALHLQGIKTFRPRIQALSIEWAVNDVWQFDLTTCIDPCAQNRELAEHASTGLAKQGLRPKTRAGVAGGLTGLNFPSCHDPPPLHLMLNSHTYFWNEILPPVDFVPKREKSTPDLICVHASAAKKHLLKCAFV